MSRVAVVARLKPGAEPRAAELLRHGPPFDPGEHGFGRHAVYLSAAEVIFVFEGNEAEWRLDDLTDELGTWPFAAAIDAWRPLLDGPPRIARVSYAWESGPMRAGRGR